MPKEIRTELERRTIDTIHATAQSFAQHAAPVKSSCWLQAKFLSNVLYEFKEANRTRAQPQYTASSSAAGSMRQQESALAKKIRHQSGPYSRDPTVDMGAGSASSLLHHGNTNAQLAHDGGGGISIHHQQQQQQGPGPTAVHSEYPQQPHHPFATAATMATPTSTTTPSPAHILGPQAAAPPPLGSYSQPQPQSQPTPQDYTFSDDAMWEAMFANAGFNITDGTFLPDAYDYRAEDENEDEGPDEDDGEDEGEADYRHRRRV